MSIQLILIRHGIAEDLAAGVCDFDRRLTPDGTRLLEKTLWRLRPYQRPSETTIVLTSPRIRAVETAEIVAAVFHSDDIRRKVFVDEGCFSGLVDFLEELPENEDHTIFVVGHQPTLGYWSNLLCGRNLPFKKGSAASFTVQGHEAGNTKFDWFFQPEDMLSLQDSGSADERTEAYAIIISRRLKELLAALKLFEQNAGNVETVHQIRVLSRKAAAALMLYRPILRRSVFTDTKRTLKQATKIFSGLRDVEVLRAAFESYSSAVPARTKENRQIRESLSLLCLKEEALAKEKMASGKLLRRIESVSSKKTIVETFFVSNHRGTMPFDGEAKIDKQRMKLMQAAKDLDPEDEKSTHAFRVSARQLRYMMELSGEPEAKSVCIQGMSLEAIQFVFGQLCEARRGIRILNSLEIPLTSGRTGSKESFAEYLNRMEKDARKSLLDSFFK